MTPNASLGEESLNSPPPTARTRPAPVVGRFDSLLAVGRQIGAATSPAAVYAVVQDAATQLLNGDRCYVIPIADELVDRSVADFDQPGIDFSPAILAQAIERKIPVVSGGYTAGAKLADRLKLAKLRSVLCAPILSDGQVVACLFVTHRQTDGQFGDVELQLAEVISTLAGAALDHVAGSEAHFRSLVQNSWDVITIVDSDGKITYQSSSVERVFGHAPEEMVGRDLVSWLHPEDADELLGFLGTDNSGKEASRLVQTRMRHKDGGWRVGESAVRNLCGDPGVLGLVLNTRDASERVELETELRTRALHDPLTGLANRALFLDRVNNALARKERDKRPIAVLFLDLDDFKLINDTSGHTVGDLLLRQSGARLKQCVHSSDLVARFGGDEFALLLENADVPAAEIVAKRIIAEFVNPYRILDQEVLVRASVGVAVPQGDETAENLLSAADTAMYVAKSRGKSRYEFFEPHMRKTAVNRSELRTDLEWVIQRDELTVHYQPLFDLPSESLSGFEALVRWDHPTRGRLGPDQFIDLAEESGKIISIGAWVLHTACHQLAVWQKALGRELTIAVNMSARQVQEPGLLDKVRSALASSELDPSSLILEITESATVEDPIGAIEVLESLKEIGVGLSIDDFGTGYSSLTYLRRFPVDQLKVDKSFVSELVTNPEDLAIVSSVINLGHSLGLDIVAEGVETADQLEKLCGMGCDQGQGWKWRAAADCHEVSAWLASLEDSAA